MERQAQIPLEKVAREPLEFDFELPFSPRSLDREPVIEISPVRFTGRIARVENGFALDGVVAFTARLECSRCLAPYPFEFDETFSLILYRQKETSGVEREIGRQDLDVSYFSSDILELAPIAEERIQLAIPMKPLCRDECAGLCPSCGEDRNSGPCGCRIKTPDPRWNALRELQKIEKRQ